MQLGFYCLMTAPAGRRAIDQPIPVMSLHCALPGLEPQPEQLAVWLDAEQRAPMPRTASVFQAVLKERSRDLASALLLTDVPPSCERSHRNSGPRGRRSLWLSCWHAMRLCGMPVL